MAHDSTNEGSERVMRVFLTFGNICALNLLWLLFSIPIITMGASTTALYSVMLKLVRNEEGAIGKSFVKAFISNFKKATLAWLAVLFVVAVIIASIMASNYMGQVFGTIYVIIAAIEIALLLLVMAFLFPLIARYENTFFGSIKNALLLSISNLGSCLKILVAWIAPIYFSSAPVVFLNIWYLWLIFGFSLIAFGTSFTIRKVFDKVSNAQLKQAEQKEEQKEKQNAKPKKSIADIARMKL